MKTESQRDLVGREDELAGRLRQQGAPEPREVPDGRWHGEGYFMALDARTGSLLWKASVGGQINAGAMSYSVNGKQYVAIAAGNSLFAYALP